jgi:hypothetical protein
MDFTFFENQSFFGKSQTSILGETEIEESLFDLPYQNLPSSQLPLEEPAEHGSPSSELLTSSGTYLNTSDHEQEEQDSDVNREAALENPTLKVYVRKRKTTELDLTRLDCHDVEELSEAQFWVEGEQREIIQSNPIPQDQESHENTSLVSSPTCDLISETRLPPKQYGYELENVTSRESEYPIVKYTTIKNLPDPLKKFANEITTSIILERVEDAMKDPKWVETMEIEMNALEENCKWKLVELPKGKKPVGCK